MTTFPETHRDLLDAPVATLATIDGKGFPQQTEVWFLHEDGALRTSLNDSRLKTRNLMKRPQCSLFILDLSNPYRYLEVRGNAKIEPGKYEATLGFNRWPVEFAGNEAGETVFLCDNSDAKKPRLLIYNSALEGGAK